MNLITSAILAISVASSSVGAAEIKPAEVDILLSSFRSCTDQAAIRLDDTRESVDTIVRASFFACSRERRAFRAHLVRDINSSNLTKTMPSDRKDRAVTNLMAEFDTNFRDRLSYKILNWRKS